MICRWLICDSRRQKVDGCLLRIVRVSKAFLPLSRFISVVELFQDEIPDTITRCHTTYCDKFTVQFCVVATRSLSFLGTDIAFPVSVSTRRRLITIHLRKHVACARDNTYECNFLGQRRCRRRRRRRLRLHLRRRCRCCRRYRAVTLAPEDCLRGETKTRRYRVPRENRRGAEVYVYMKRPACLFLTYTQVRKYIVTSP